MELRRFGDGGRALARECAGPVLSKAPCRNRFGKEPDVTRRFHRVGLLTIACLALAVGRAPLALAESTADGHWDSGDLPEYAVKAAFVYNFARFTEWPASAFAGSGSPLRLCVLGQDPFDGALDTIAGKKIRNRELVISYPIWAEEAQRCHILFISESVRERLPEIIALVNGFPILTIGDMPEVARSGGIIGLEKVENRIRFQVNLDAMERSGLRLSSRLLDLAIIVRNEHFPGRVN